MQVYNNCITSLINKKFMDNFTKTLIVLLIIGFIVGAFHNSINGYNIPI